LQVIQQGLPQQPLQQTLNSNGEKLALVLCRRRALYQAPYLLAIGYLGYSQAFRPAF
jgi:hypothetical protein